MKKLLMITSDFPPTVSGISTYYYNLLKRLPPDKVAVLTPWVEGCEEFDRQAPFKIVRQRCSTGASTAAKLLRMFSLWAAAPFAIRREEAKELHCGQIVAGGPLGMFMRIVFGLPYRVYLHGGDGERLRRFALVNRLVRAAIDRSETTFTNSESTRQEFIGIGGDPDKLAVVHPSVDPEAFRPDVDPGRVRARHGLEGKQVVLTVARLGHIKGHDRIIRAMPRIAQAAPDAAYLIAGDGPERPRLEALAQERGVQDRVVFAGYVPDEELPEYYAACDVFAMTSIFVPNHDVEGFGIVYLEASATGKPVVGSRTGGIAEAVAEGESGLLVDPDDEDEVAAALTRLLTDRDFAAKLGRQGRLRVEREFSWDRSAERLRSLLS